MGLFLKVCIVIAALGAMALGLLSLRQQRYEVSNQIAVAHQRGVEQQRSLWRMRAEVARHSGPSQIRGAINKLKIDAVPVQEQGSARTRSADASGAAGGPGAAGGSGVEQTPPAAEPAARRVASKAKANVKPAAKPAAKQAKPASKQAKPAKPSSASPKKSPEPSNGR